MCHAFPFGNVIAEERTRWEQTSLAINIATILTLLHRDMIYSLLPQEQEEASLLIERFFLNIGWLYNFTPQRQLEEWIRTHYDPVSPAPLHPHRLAVIYMVFALNTLIDAHPSQSSIEPASWHSNLFLTRAVLVNDHNVLRTCQSCTWLR